MASAMVASPIQPCQCSMGNCAVMMVALPLGAIVHDFQQVPAAVGFQGLQRPVVENQHFDFGEREETALVRAVAARDAQLFK